jgi:hypothetical protein
MDLSINGDESVTPVPFKLDAGGAAMQIAKVSK